MGTKVYINGPGDMTKMAAMAINSKTPQDQKTYDFETLQETWGVGGGGCTKLFI